jgi:hypothetical protein
MYQLPQTQRVKGSACCFQTILSISKKKFPTNLNTFKILEKSQKEKKNVTATDML